MQRIPERDWKAWRKLSAEAIERFCARILDEAGSFRTASGSAHSRYLDLFRYLRERDDEIAEVFNDQRRSNAYVQIAAAITGLANDLSPSCTARAYVPKPTRRDGRSE